MRSLILFLLLIVCLPARADDPAPFEIREGDRVVLLGDALLERENTYGYLETRMHEQFPDRKFTVRNLSWAGDTPRGWSRASFDPPEKGFERLKEAIALVKPTVVFLGYGMAASLQEMTDRAQDIALNRDEARYGSEPMSAARFKKELGELMEAIVETRNAERGTRKDSDAAPVPSSEFRAPRFVLLSPIRHEDLRAVRPGLPDPAPHNALLEQYSKAIEELAKENGARFVSLLDLTWHPSDGSQWGFVMTDNGIHLNHEGYGSVPGRVERALNWAADVPPVTLPGVPGLLPPPKDTEKMRIEQEQKKTSDKHAKVKLAFRAAVLKKNDLFFHRFRPANATYLFGFRKHEQGQNAKEIPKFDPLIEAADAEIDRLKRTRNSELGTRKPEEPASTRPVSADATLPPLPNFTVLDGYQIDLWAENPLHRKADADELGRARPALGLQFVRSTRRSNPARKPTTRSSSSKTPIAMARPTRATVFADGLLIPTGGRARLGGQAFNAKRQTPDTPNVKGLGCPEPTALNSQLSPRHHRLLAKPRISTLNYPPPPATSASPPNSSTSPTPTATATPTSGAIVFSGFGTEDTHHIIHTLRWGPDGRLYFNQSVYIHSHLETPWGMVRLNCRRHLRLRSAHRTRRGLLQRAGGIRGATPGTMGPDRSSPMAPARDGISWAFPGATYFTHAKARRKIMPEHLAPAGTRSSAASRSSRARTSPTDWQGNAVTCDFRAHRMVRFAIEDLAGFADSGPSRSHPSHGTNGTDRNNVPPSPATSPGNCPTSSAPTTPAFRPIDIRLGPDGALYIADWSNPVINHGEVDFRDPRRDKHMRPHLADHARRTRRW